MKEKEPNLFTEILVDICQDLPWHLTLLEEGGLCSEDGPDCQYAQKVAGRKSETLCKKKTYTPLQERVPA